VFRTGGEKARVASTLIPWLPLSINRSRCHTLDRNSGSGKHRAANSTGPFAFLPPRPRFIASLHIVGFSMLVSTISAGSGGLSHPPCSSGCNILLSPPLPFVGHEIDFCCFARGGWLPPCPCDDDKTLHARCPGIIQKATVLLSPKTSLPCNGHLHTEIFLWPSLFCGCQLIVASSVFTQIAWPMCSANAIAACI